MIPPASPSPWALRLGHAGLLPFLAGAAAVMLTEGALRHQLGWALLAYAATIGAFLGGIHWGAAMREPAPPGASLAWGVVPQLAGWLALLLPLPLGLTVAGSLLILSYAVDRQLYPAAGLSGWLPLRLSLTVVASACCLWAAWVSARTP